MDFNSWKKQKEEKNIDRGIFYFSFEKMPLEEEDYINTVNEKGLLLVKLNDKYHVFGLGSFEEQKDLFFKTRKTRRENHVYIDFLIKNPETEYISSGFGPSYNENYAKAKEKKKSWHEELNFCQKNNATLNSKKTVRKKLKRR